MRGKIVRVVLADGFDAHWHPAVEHHAAGVLGVDLVDPLGDAPADLLLR